MSTYASHTADGTCVFCAIAAGSLATPGIFWENDEFLAFLSIDPNTEGFSCVIPKKHWASDVLKLPDDVLQRFILAAQRVAAILEDYFSDVGRVGLMMEGTGINHAHIKLMPLHGTENLKNGKWQQMLSGKEFWFDRYEGWICSGGGPKANPDHLRELAAHLKEHLHA